MRILIVDDHPITRDGLRTALTLTDDVEVVGEAASGEEAIEVVEDSKPAEWLHGGWRGRLSPRADRPRVCLGG